MAEVRIKRSRASSSNNQNDLPKINIQLDIPTLNMMCRFVISDSTYVRRYDLSQLKKFMNVVDTVSMAAYSIEIKERLDFINIALEARLNLRLTNKDAIYSYISSKFPKDIEFITIDDVISREEVGWVNETVSETLKYSFIYEDIPKLRELCNEFMETSIGHRGDIVNKFESFNTKMTNQFREAKVQDSNSTIFSLKGELFENQITDTYNAIISPSRRLQTGMVGFNMLTGGLENGRVYMLVGDSGVGKSLTLLNIMVQLKRYNKDYKTKDPTKTPCICMLTMENTMVESLTRLFALVAPNNAQMHSYQSLNDIIRIMREEGGLVVSEDSPIDIVIKYKPNHSVSTDYLYELYDELSDMGYEMICLIQDHVKRIRASEGDKEFRIELGNIVNEFKVFAADKDIPILTDSHVNRQGSITIEKGAARGVADVTKRIGKGDVGESSMMIENLDMAIVINKEWDEFNTMYMCFSAIKMRDNSQTPYIAQPFVSGSSIKLVEDVNLPKPMYKQSLKSQGDMYRNSMPMNVRATPYNMMNNSAGFFEDQSYFEDGNRQSFEPDNFNIDIGTPDIVKEMEALTIKENNDSYVDEDMWSRAARLGMICPIILHDNKSEDDNGEDLVNQIENMM